MPSFFAMAIFDPTTPMIDSSSRSALVVRSGLATCHDIPRSVVRNRRLAATNTVFGSWGEMTTGVSQFHRYSSSPALGSGRIVWRSLDVRSTRFMRPPCDSAYMTFGSDGSICAWKPSPPPMTNQSSFVMPSAARTALGPHHVSLSCRPPHTV